ERQPFTSCGPRSRVSGRLRTLVCFEPNDADTRLGASKLNRILSRFVARPIVNNNDFKILKRLSQYTLYGFADHALTIERRDDDRNQGVHGVLRMNLNHGYTQIEGPARRRANSRKTLPMSAKPHSAKSVPHGDGIFWN